VSETELETERPNVEYGDLNLAHENEILHTVVGSGVHGIAIEGTDDEDEMAVFIEPVEHVIGTAERMDIVTYRTKPEGERSEPGDIDLSMYSLRKYIRLAAVGNPTAVLPLWCPQSSIIHMTETGRLLREHRSSFMSQQSVHRFLGYMDAQFERMMGRGKRNRVPNRPELVERYGWDVKYGAHALRLAYQGYEICLMGRLTLPMAEGPREHVLAVKRGEVTRTEVANKILNLTKTTRQVLKNGTPLPEKPDWDTIGAFSVRAHLDHWERAKRRLS
jgi:hypothetical protein